MHQEHLSLSLGVETMDASHRKLCTALEHAGRAADADFADAYTALVQAVERDFREEEVMMEAMAFPALHAHLEQHARVLAGLHHADPFVQDGDPALGREALALLPQWFALHHASMDRQLADAVLDGPRLAERQD
ncbi:MAG: hemerythrin domain-containing protein [Pseudomonadota bacterium]